MPTREPTGEGPVRAETPAASPHREVDLLLPLAAAIGLILGWYVFLDYARLVVALAGQTSELARRIWVLGLVLVLASIGVLGLSWLAARDARRRRLAEKELTRLNDELARRVVRRTAMLRARTKDLHDSRLREQLREKEAELAFQAGQVEAAGAYLHGVGNALSSLDLELLRLKKAADGAARIETAFDALAGSLADGQPDEAAQRLVALREVVLGRAFPRLAEVLAALTDIKTRMVDALERRRGEFERPGAPVPYLQSFRVDQELAAMLDRLPRATGSDPVARDIDVAVTVKNRKHPFLTGLASLLRQVLDMAPGRVAVRLRREDGRGAVITVEGAGEEGLHEPAVAAFIDFLNENGGALRFEAASAGQPARLEVSLDDAPSAAPLS